MSTPLLARPVRAAAAALALAFALAGCSGITAPIGSDQAPEVAPDGTSQNGSETADPAPAPAGGAPAVLTLTGQSFTFDVSCVITSDDTLIYGPGKDDDSGEPAYLSVDIYDVDGWAEGEVRVDLGTDQQFTSSDNIYTSMIGGGNEYGILYDPGRTTIESQYAANGGPIGAGTLVAECD